MTALLLAALAAPAVEPTPSFARDVVPVLTRAGCNQGACHGKLAGQNGFRLSLRGYAPSDDFVSLTREFDGRRLDRATPGDSLLLKKAAGQLPHDGGMLFGPKSREYRTLLNWVRAGAPGPDAAEAGVVKLELASGRRPLAVGDTEHLRAWATFADGTRRDVTWLTKFDANDPVVVTVTPGGVATARRPGVGAVRAAFLTEVAVVSFAVPRAAGVDAAKFEHPPHPPHPIDDAVFAQLRTLRIEPSPPATAREFARRAYLDAVGRLPRPEEVAAFVADPDRGRLADALLASPEFTDYWTLILADLLQNRRERDHDVRGVKGVRAFHAWLRERVAANRPWAEIAREVLTAEGAVTENPAVGYAVVAVGEAKSGDQSDAPEAVAQSFLGSRIGCAKCHNHPLERHTQDDYYHFAAFFSRVKLERREPGRGVTRLAMRDGDDAPSALQPRTGERLRPQTLDRAAPKLAPGSDPRGALADWVTGPANANFSGAMVNRIWKHYLGVGLVDPVDDLRATNPPSNPALWGVLNREFVAGGTDLRKLMRLILTSRTYGLSSATTPGNATDTRFSSHYLVKRLPAEVFLDAVSDATGEPEKFPGYAVGLRAVQLPDPAAASRFLDLFGRSPRTTACACERTGEVTLSQLLYLANAAELGDKANGRWLREALAAEPDDGRLLDRITGRTLCRPATGAERATVAAMVAAGGKRDEVAADFLWAILNSKDFAFNH